MADFPRALDAALRAHYSLGRALPGVSSPVDTARGLTARVNGLEKAYGSAKAAAQAAGIHPDTWRRWKAGTRAPSKASLGKVESAHFALTRAAKVAAQGTPASIVIHAIVVCDPQGARYINRANSGDHKDNAPEGSGYRPFKTDALDEAQRRDVVTAWAAGRTRGEVAGVLLEHIAAEYPEEFAFEGDDVIVEIT